MLTHSLAASFLDKCLEWKLQTSGSFRRKCMRIGVTEVLPPQENNAKLILLEAYDHKDMGWAKI